MFNFCKKCSISKCLLHSRSLLVKLRPHCSPSSPASGILNYLFIYLFIFLPLCSDLHSLEAGCSEVLLMCWYHSHLHIFYCKGYLKTWPFSVYPWVTWQESRCVLCMSPLTGVLCVNIFSRSLFACLHFLFVFAFEMGFLCVNNPGCPGTQSVDQAGFRLTEICLPLPPKCWD